MLFVMTLTVIDVCTITTGRVCIVWTTRDSALTRLGSGSMLHPILSLTSHVVAFVGYGCDAADNKRNRSLLAFHERRLCFLPKCFLSHLAHNRAAE